MAYVNTAAHSLTSQTIILSQLLVEYSEFLHSWSYQLIFSQIKCAVYDEHQHPELFKLQRYPTMSQILDCLSVHPLICTPAIHCCRLNLCYFTCDEHIGHIDILTAGLQSCYALRYGNSDYERQLSLEVEYHVTFTWW